MVPPAEMLHNVIKTNAFEHWCDLRTLWGAGFCRLCTPTSPSRTLYYSHSSRVRQCSWPSHHSQSTIAGCRSRYKQQANPAFPLHCLVNNHDWPLEGCILFLGFVSILFLPWRSLRCLLSSRRRYSKVAVHYWFSSLTLQVLSATNGHDSSECEVCRQVLFCMTIIVHSVPFQNDDVTSAQTLHFWPSRLSSQVAETAVIAPEALWTRARQHPLLPFTIHPLPAK